MLGHIALALGRAGDAADHYSRSAAHAQRIAEHFWDASRGIFANRLWNDRFVSSLAPTSFFPLLIRAADSKQITSLMRHLASPKSFGGRFVLPSVSRSDPAFRQNVYWRGRIWPILNWLVWLGLKRNGLATEARTLQMKSWTLFAGSWKSRLAPENFNAVTGKALDQPDTDPFYSWTALMPLMAVAEIMDFDPWDGWCLRNGRDELSLGPLNSPVGHVTVSRSRGWLRMTAENGFSLETNIQPGITGITISTDAMRFTLPERLKAGALLRCSKPVAEALQVSEPLWMKRPGEFRLRATGNRRELVELRFSS
jgi:putative isomerase